jgi:hypothetical protein
VDLNRQGYPFVQDHPFINTKHRCGSSEDHYFSKEKSVRSIRSDQMQCSNTAAAEALLHLQSSHIQLNAPSRQQAGFQTKLYSSVGLNQHGSFERTLTRCSKRNPTPEQRGSSSSPTMFIQTNSDSMVKKTRRPRNSAA